MTFWTDVGSGGSALLTEIPEIFAAKRLLMVRAPHRNTFDSNVAGANAKRYFSIMRSRFPKILLGNISGGIATLEEKSSVARAHSATLADGPRELLRTLATVT